MNDKNFNTIVRNRLDSCKDILIKKNEEYSSDTDRLHNFKVAARTNNTTPEKALWGMYTKHLVSVMDLKDSPETATKEILSEKITDSINYHLLLEALLQERIVPKQAVAATANHIKPRESPEDVSQKNAGVTYHKDYIALALEAVTSTASMLWESKFKQSHPEWVVAGNLMGVLGQLNAMVLDLSTGVEASEQLDENGLKHCPFCGGKVIGPEAADSDWWIECSNCEIIMSRDSRTHLISEWNSRT